MQQMLGKDYIFFYFLTTNDYIAVNSNLIGSFFPANAARIRVK
jgi:hypothetical protein